MRSLALGAAATAATMIWAVGLQAADLAYPSPSVGPPQYGMAPPPTAALSRVVVIPGAASPQYGAGYPGYDASVPPAVVGPSPYGAAPPVAVVPGTTLPPRVACAPVWRCGYQGCGWAPSCASHPEFHSEPYGPPGPLVYGPEAQPVPETYSGPYAPQLYSGHAGPYAGDQIYGSPYHP